MPTPPIDEHCLPVLIEFNYDEHTAEFFRELRNWELDYATKSLGIPRELIGEPSEMPALITAEDNFIAYLRGLGIGPLSSLGLPETIQSGDVTWPDDMLAQPNHIVGGTDGS